MSSPPPSLEHLALSATRLAAQLPPDLAFHRTIDDALRTDLDDLSDRTHDLLSALLTLARPNAPVPLTNPSSAPLTSPSAFKHVIDTVDWLLEGADDSLDVLTGKKRPPQISIHQPAAPPAPTRILPNPAPDNRDVPFAYDAFSHPYRRAITRLVVPAHVFEVLPAVHPKDVLPAVHPKDAIPALAVDDAATIPPLPTDPSSFHTVPVQLIDTPEAFDALIARLRRHVARAYPTSPSASKSSSHAPATHELLLALDLEHHSQHSYRGFVCLVQLTTRLRPLASSGPTSQVEQADYLLDALALRAHMHALNEFTADARIVKILHGAASDIPWLAENFVVPSGENDTPTGAGVSTVTAAGASPVTGAGVSTVPDAGVSTVTSAGVSIVTMFDTYHAARALGLPSLSLAHLLKTYCAYEPDKRLARADWRVRPLPPTHLSYARSDTHFLPFIYDRLKEELAGVAPPTLPADPHGDGEAVDIPIDVLVAGSSGSPSSGLKDIPSSHGPTEEDAPDSALTTVLQASGRVCLRTPRWLTSATATLSAAAMATARRAGRENLLDESSPDHAIYLALYRWRDATARAADEGVGTILPNSALLLIADKWRNLIAAPNGDLGADPTPTPLGLAAPHAALASLVAPAALPAPVRLRAAEVVGVVLGAVRGYAAKQVDAAKEDAAKAKEGNEAARKAGDEEKGEKGEIEEKGEKGEIEEKGANAKTTSAIKTTPTPTPTASLFGRRPAVLTPSTSVAASSSLFGGALGARAASSSLLGDSAAPSATSRSAPTTASSRSAPTPAASRSALFGGTLRNAASSTKVPSPTVAGAPSPTVAAAPSPTVAATPSLASIAARVHASFGVMPAVPSSSSAPAFDADTSGASTAEHAFVPAGQRSTASVTVFSSVKKSTGLTEAERKALAEKDEGEDDAMDDGEDDAVDEDTDSSGSDSNNVPAKSGSRKSDKGDNKSKKDKKSKEPPKAAPSVAADAIVAGAGARQKKRKRTKGPALDLSGEAGASTSTSAQNPSASTSDTTLAADTAPFDYASVPNILDAPGPPSTPTTERPRKKKRRVEEKGPHFRAPAPAPAEVRGVKVNLAHTFGK
ncbi:hypothetical protein EV121DRAFT_270366 [Schizophyllum commune]